jgi:hypothetical protein
LSFSEGKKSLYAFWKKKFRAIMGRPTADRTHGALQQTADRFVTLLFVGLDFALKRKKIVNMQIQEPRCYRFWQKNQKNNRWIEENFRFFSDSDNYNFQVFLPDPRDGRVGMGNFAYLLVPPEQLLEWSETVKAEEFHSRETFIQERNRGNFVVPFLDIEPDYSNLSHGQDNFESEGGEFFRIREQEFLDFLLKCGQEIYGAGKVDKFYAFVFTRQKKRDFDDANECPKINYHVYFRLSKNPNKRNFSISKKKLLERLTLINKKFKKHQIEIDLKPISSGQFRFYNTAKFTDESIRGKNVSDPHVEATCYTAEKVIKFFYEEETRDWKSRFSWTEVEQRFKIEPHHTFIQPYKPKINGDDENMLAWSQFTFNLPEGMDVPPHNYLAAKNFPWDWRDKTAFWEKFDDLAKKYAKDYPKFEEEGKKLTAKFIRFIWGGNFVTMVKSNIVKRCNIETESFEIDTLNTHKIISAPRYGCKKYTFVVPFDNEEEYEGEPLPKRRKRKNKTKAVYLDQFIAENCPRVHGVIYGSFTPPENYINLWAGTSATLKEMTDFVGEYPLFSRICIQMFHFLLYWGICKNEGEDDFSKWAFSGMLHMIIKCVTMVGVQHDWDYVFFVSGEPGCGKGTFQDLLKILIGETNVHIEVANAGVTRSITSNFNDFQVNKSLCVWDELENLNSEATAVVKQAVTDTTLSVNPKHAQFYTINNTAKFMFFCNKIEELLMDLEDRRWIVSKIAEKYIPPEFFTQWSDFIVRRNGWKAILFYIYTLRCNGNFKSVGVKPFMSKEKARLMMKRNYKFLGYLRQGYEGNWRLLMENKSKFIISTPCPIAEATVTVECVDKVHPPNLNLMRDFCTNQNSYTMGTVAGAQSDYSPSWPPYIIITNLQFEEDDRMFFKRYNELWEKKFDDFFAGKGRTELLKSGFYDNVKCFEELGYGQGDTCLPKVFKIWSDREHVAKNKFTECHIAQSGVVVFLPPFTKALQFFKSLEPSHVPGISEINALPINFENFEAAIRATHENLQTVGLREVLTEGLTRDTLFEAISNRDNIMNCVISDEDYQTLKKPK